MSAANRNGPLRATDPTHKKAGRCGPAAENRESDGDLFDLLVERVALEVRVVFLLLDALRDGLLVAEREVTGGRLALFFGFGALQGDEFLHDLNRLKGQEERP